MVNHYLYRFADKYMKLWLIIGFIFILLGIGVLGAVYMDYAPTEIEQLTETKTETFQMEAQATSTASESSEFFNEGDTITGPIHFVEPNGTLEITQTFSSEREATVDNSVYVRINGTREGWSFWDERFVITDESIQVNGTETVDSTINISKYRERSLNVRGAYEREGIVTVNVIVESDYSTDLYSGSLANSSRITFRDNAYTVIPPNLSDSGVHSYSTSVGTREVRDSIYMNSGFALIGAGLVFILIRVLLSDPSRVKKDYMLMQFSEWISVADSDRTYISDKSNTICLSSCEDVIDVAADSRSRAIFIEDEGKVITLQEDTVYVYEVTEEDEEPVRFSLFGSDDSEDSVDEDESGDDGNSDEMDDDQSKQENDEPDAELNNGSESENVSEDDSDNKSETDGEKDKSNDDSDNDSERSGFMFTN